MKIVVLEKKDKELEFKIEGERHTFPELLRHALAQDPDVDFVAYKLHHPMDSSAVFFLRTHKGKPKTALTKAVSKIEKELDSFKKAVENAL